MERAAAGSQSERLPQQNVAFELDLPPPYQRPRLRLGRRALSDAERFRTTRVSGFPGAKVKLVVVTEAGRARVVKRAAKSNKDRKEARTLAILDAASKAS